MVSGQKSRAFTQGIPRIAYTGYTAFGTLVLLPFYLIYFAIPSRRPNPQWTFKQALSNYLTKTVFDCLAVIELPTSQITSAKTGEFVLLEPGNTENYQGLLDNSEIQPGKIGAVWVPSVPSIPVQPIDSIILHIHGGAFVTLSPGMQNVQNGPRLLAKEFETSVLMVDYRLSCNPKSVFPAALQDVITAYRSLLDLGYSNSQIILSGDSAGANLVLALLRYISEQEELDKLPCPAGAALWSPWIDLSVKDEDFVQHPNYSTDYLTPSLLSWGLREYVPIDQSASGPYFSPGRHPFSTSARLFFHSGSSEAIVDQQNRGAAAFAAIQNNQVELYTTPNAMHDIFAAGSDMGFPGEQIEAIKAARRFLQR